MSNVCADCVDEEYLHKLILQDGELDCCDFCGKENIKCFSLEDLADVIHDVLQEHYYQTSPEPEGLDYLLAKEGLWEQPGRPVHDVILDLLETTNDVAAAIHDYLSDIHDATGKDSLCDLQPYDCEAQYEEKPIEIYQFEQDWTYFKTSITSESRYFNQGAERVLNDIFKDIGDLSTHYESPVIQTLSPESNIYRARFANSHNALKSILHDAPASLGAPPTELANAGRMNAEGISVFYGASDITTCIAEIRPPVGSSVVIGCFSPLRDLRLLDLTLLKDVYLSGSIFDPEHIEALTRTQFLKRLVDELSEPVLPGTETREYLPTQFISEFLSSKDELNLDGVMFMSTQVAQREDSNDGEAPPPGVYLPAKNIVLFAHASVVDKYELPSGTKLDISLGFGHLDDYDDMIYISEEIPDSNDVRPETSDGIRDIFDFIPEPPIPDPSLRLDIENIEVKYIEGMNYDTSDRTVVRHRHNERDDNSDF